MAKTNNLDARACLQAAAVCACFNFRKASRAVTQLFDNVLQPSGLRSTQFVILVAIQAESPMPLPDLALLLNVDRSTLTRNLQPLERDGLVKTASPKNSRASVVRLTAKGKRLLARTVPLWEEAQGRFVHEIGKRRWNGMLKDLNLVVDTLGRGR